jgi:hypothetical protein
MDPPIDDMIQVKTKTGYFITDLLEDELNIEYMT